MAHTADQKLVRRNQPMPTLEEFSYSQNANSRLPKRNNRLQKKRLIIVRCDIFVYKLVSSANRIFKQRS